MNHYLFLFLDEEQGSGATSPPMGFAGMFDFFGELKRILVSLTEVASLVQHVNCDESNSNGENCDMETEEPEIQVSWFSMLSTGSKKWKEMKWNFCDN